jgi:hypothetical protein
LGQGIAAAIDIAAAAAVSDKFSCCSWVPQRGLFCVLYVGGTQAAFLCFCSGRSDFWRKSRVIFELGMLKCFALRPPAIYLV